MLSHRGFTDIGLDSPQDITERTKDFSVAENVEADQQAIAEMSRGRIAVVATMADDGSLVSRPLVLVQRSIGDLYFFTRFVGQGRADPTYYLGGRRLPRRYGQLSADRRSPVLRPNPR